jgi:hypothetical protein
VSGEAYGFLPACSSRRLFKRYAVGIKGGCMTSCPKAAGTGCFRGCWCRERHTAFCLLVVAVSCFNATALVSKAEAWPLVQEQQAQPVSKVVGVGRGIRLFACLKQPQVVSTLRCWYQRRVYNLLPKRSRHSLLQRLLVSGEAYGFLPACSSHRLFQRYAVGIKGGCMASCLRAAGTACFEFSVQV